MPTDNKRLRCKKCNRQFTRPQGTNRLYCFDCRPERAKEPNWAQIAPFRGKSGENGEESGQIEGNVTRLSRITLEKAGVLETWQGGAVMALAQHIDEGKGGGSAGVAGAIRAHAEAMARAMEIAETEEVDNVTSIFNQGSS